MRPTDVPIVQFIALCVLPIMAIVYAVRTRGRQSWWSRVGTTVTALLLFALTVPAFLSMCGQRSNPQYQLLIPLGSALLVALVTGSSKLRWSGIAICYTAFFALTFQYVSTVDGRLYVGSRKVRNIEPERITAEWHTPLTHIYRVQRGTRVSCTEARAARRSEALSTIGAP